MTSCCIGLISLEELSPALFLGALVGALVYNLSFFEFELSHLSVLAVAGMAAVSSSVIGAPITAIILILELTGSYEYSIASIIPIAICTYLTSRIFGNSFDKQLLSRGIQISKGREQILLNEIKVQNYASSKFTRISTKMNTDKVKNLLLKNIDTEGYILSEDDKFIGKIRLIDIIDKNNQNILNFIEKTTLLRIRFISFKLYKKIIQIYW